MSPHAAENSGEEKCASGQRFVLGSITEKVWMCGRALWAGVAMDGWRGGWERVLLPLEENASVRRHPPGVIAVLGQSQAIGDGLTAAAQCEL